MLVKSQVKYIQSLSQKKFRDEAGVFVAEGPKIINELLAGGGVEPVAVYATAEWKRTTISDPNFQTIFHEISASDLDRISFLSTPNQVLGLFKKPVFHTTGDANPASTAKNTPDETSADNTSQTLSATSTPPKTLANTTSQATSAESTHHEIAASSTESESNQNPVSASFEPRTPITGITLVLDTIQDPGNLGTIIRCADWFGVKRIVCNPESADNFAPKVVQSTMASIARVEVVYTDLKQYLANNRTLPVYAAALNGKPLSSFKAITPAILVIGNESKGISPEILALATDLITIPRFGKAESLNAAVATGILLAALTIS